ncbi:CTP synthase-like isoform X1 [Iris pallida]|uniref:CTP synthase-like isoform X1 n=1 Tax=Iris pallida TaxID=29817 RepID=A0AAX6GD24_IRIPA|nr:CTP synthase-like isoform X1 [Iris pallida]
MGGNTFPFRPFFSRVPFLLRTSLVGEAFSSQDFFATSRASLYEGGYAHIDAIQEWIEQITQVAGDIESMPLIEALGQFSYRVDLSNFCLVHVSLVPVLNIVREQVSILLPFTM